MTDGFGFIMILSHLETDKNMCTVQRSCMSFQWLQIVHSINIHKWGWFSTSNWSLCSKKSRSQSFLNGGLWTKHHGGPRILRNSQEPMPRGCGCQATKIGIKLLNMIRFLIFLCRLLKLAALALISQPILDMLSVDQIHM